MSEEYLVIWLPVESSGIQSLINCENLSSIEYIPYGLVGEELEKYNNEGIFNIDLVNLQFGIILGFEDIENKFPLNNVNYKYDLIYILNELVEKSTVQTVEEMILSTFHFLGKNFGKNAADKVVRSAILIEPKSKLINRMHIRYRDSLYFSYLFKNKVLKSYI